MGDYSVKDWYCDVLKLPFFAVQGFDESSVRDGEMVLYSHYHAESLLKIISEKDAEIAMLRSVLQGALGVAELEKRVKALEAKIAEMEGDNR